MYTLNEKRWLLALARQSIFHYLKSQQDLKEIASEFPSAFTEKRGSFVTLTLKEGGLRGCIGNIEPVYPVYEGVMKNALNAAFRDPRFFPLAENEFSETSIEVSVLSEPQNLDYKSGDELIQKINPGKDGVIISKGGCAATFLPQVWEQIKNPEDFLAHLCVKCSLQPDEWKKGDLNVDIYSVDSFDEKQIAFWAG
jgi:AmmeMemoRadiSam system protein A